MRSAVYTLLTFLWMVSIFTTTLFSQDNDKIWSKIFIDQNTIDPGDPNYKWDPPASQTKTFLLGGSGITVNPNFRSLPTTNTTQSELSVDVAPFSENIVFASANTTNWPVSALFGTGVYWTLDGAQTWGGSDVPPFGSNSGDPASVIGNNGNFYENYINNPGGQGISVSTDNGATWSTHTVAPNPGSLADKNHMMIDKTPGSPYEGRLYVAWTDFGGPNDLDVVLRYSTDDGVTWSSSINLSSFLNAVSHSQGVNIQTAANGDVYATIDFSSYTEMVWIEFDNDWRTFDSDDDALVEISTDGGSSWFSVWERNGVDERNSHEVVDITTIIAGQTNVQVRVRVIQPGFDWWWTIDNFAIYGMFIVPVELTSFAAVIAGDNIQLNWITATDLNNQGFEIQRRTGDGEFEKVGFVPGHGTTTDIQTYSYVDSKVASGNYIYRLKQIDFNGIFEYSDEVAVDVTAPLEFALEQNYPNPFNPGTVIKYSIPENGFVTINVYNLLGEKVTTLVSRVQKAGRYEINFDASNLASGIYVYSLKSGSFNSVKKMLLMK
ncbi:MAG: T9SS type A sorting domain-containing protein [Bacteroidetes bacterium]|nr:T9SS type A sorting domain-containing protein [Bacteroidota bacterium]